MYGVNENNIGKIISYSPLIMMPILVIIITITMVTHNQMKLNHSIELSKKSLISQENNKLKTEIDKINDLIEYQNNIFEQLLRERVKERVESAVAIGNKIHNKFSQSKPKPEVNRIIKETLRPLVWNNGESFIWILDFDGKFILAPNYLKDKEGSSIINFQDATGRYVIKEEIELTKHGGSGFMIDTFTKSNGIPGKQYNQTIFVKAFGHNNWYVGSGEFHDTAYKKLDNDLINMIKTFNHNSARSRYVFLLNIEDASPVIVPKVSVIGNLKPKAIEIMKKLQVL